MPDELAPRPTAMDVETACGRARAEREAVTRGLERLRAIRRDLLEATHLVELAARDADRHAVKVHKDALRRAYREAIEDAPDDAAKTAAAATWLGAITETNNRMRAAMRDLARGRGRVALLEAQLRGADLEAATARIRAEVAEAACAEARARHAEAEEASVLLDARDRTATVAAAGEDATVAAQASVTVADGGEALDPDAGPGAPAGIAAPPVESATIRRLLADDPATHAAIARELAEMSGKLPARYLLLLKSLVDGLGAAAIDAGEVAFDHEHPLWSQFSPEESRLVIRGLRDLGFRLDLEDGWFGGRAPTATDLASALGFAGHDLRALRAVPTSDQLRDLPMSVRVEVLGHLRRWAPDLTLEQMTRALGDRAGGLDELWDEWGRVRPLLVSGTPATGRTVPA